MPSYSWSQSGAVRRNEAPTANTGGSDASTFVDAVSGLVSFFREYKKRSPGDPSEASTTQFLWDGAIIDAQSAMRVVQLAIANWCDLLRAQQGAHWTGPGVGLTAGEGARVTRQYCP